MYHFSQNNAKCDQLYPYDQVAINELNSCLALGSEDKTRGNIFDKYFVYLQNGLHLSYPKTWAKAKY